MFYHICPWNTWSNNIQENGLLPKTIARGINSDDFHEPRAYLFKTLQALEKAMDNWYLDRHSSTKHFAILEIDIPKGISISDDPSVAGSFYVTEPIPPENIKLVRKENVNLNESCMKLYNLLFETNSLSEMPIGNFTTIGDFSKPESFTSKVDRDIVTHIKGVEKIRKQWQKTPFIFDIYLVNLENIGRFLEVGEVEEEFIRNEMKISEELLPINHDNITIIFTNNDGTEAVPMSGWIMAHRLGHAFNASSGSGKPFAQKWRNFTSIFQELLNKILTEIFRYGRSESSDPKKKLILANHIGTMKSARDNELRSYYELVYELFAQYLLTGKIKLKPINKNLATELESYSVDTQNLDLINNDLGWYSGMLEEELNKLLALAKGSILVM